MSDARPIIATMIGDPCGIGPEVVAKAWSSGEPHKYSRPVLIGSAGVMEQGVKIAGLNIPVKTIDSIDQLGDSPGVIEIIDSGKFDLQDITLGEDNEACGRICAEWIGEAEQLARSGAVAGMTMAPISRLR